MFLLPKRKFQALYSMSCLLFFIFITIKLPRFFSRYKYFPIFSKYYQNSGDLQNQQLYHNAYTFMMKLPYLLIWLFVLLTVWIYRVVIYKGEKLIVKNINTVSFGRLNGLLLLTLLFFIYQNMTYYDLLGASEGALVYGGLTVLYWYLYITQLFRKKNELSEGESNGLKPSRWTKGYLNKGFTGILTLALISIVGVTGYRYRTYASVSYPETLTLSGEATGLSQTRKLCDYRDEAIVCSYDKEYISLFRSYQQPELRVSVNNESLQAHMESNALRINVNDYQLTGVDGNTYIFEKRTSALFDFFIYEVLEVVERTPDGVEHLYPYISDGDFTIEFALKKK